MHIGLISIADLSDYSPEWVTYNIGRYLDSDHRVTVVGAQRASDRIRDSFDCVSYYDRLGENDVRRKILLLPLTLLTVVRFVRDQRPDVLASVGNLSVHGFVCALVALVTDTTSVVRVTNDLYDFYDHYDAPGRRAAAFVENNVLGHLAVRLADRVIVLGEQMAEELEMHGVDPESISVVPQPLEHHAETPEEGPIDIRERHDIPDEVDLALFVGSFSPHKGPELLVETVRYVVERTEDVHFLLVGAYGQYESWVRSELASTPQVHLEDWVPHEHLHYYYDQSDMLLFTSVSEGLPNTVLEALYHDLPVVASDSCGEATSFISNTGATPTELGNIVLEGKNQIELDDFPDSVESSTNRELYTELFDEVER